MDPISGRSLPPIAARTNLGGQNPAGGDLWYQVQTTRQGHLIVQATSADGGTAQLALFDDAHNRSALAISTIVHAGGTLDQQVNAGQTFYVRLQGTSHNVALSIDNTAGSMAVPAAAGQCATTTSLPRTSSASPQSAASEASLQQSALTRVNQWVAMLQQVQAKQTTGAGGQKRSAGLSDAVGSLLQLWDYK